MTSNLHIRTQLISHHLVHKPLRGPRFAFRINPKTNDLYSCVRHPKGVYCIGSVNYYRTAPLATYTEPIRFLVSFGPPLAIVAVETHIQMKRQNYDSLLAHL